MTLTARERYKAALLGTWRKMQGAQATVTGVQRLNWAAASVKSRSSGCAAARAIADVRYLVGEAPRLPLPGCADPAACSCVYRKHADRRAGPRREVEETGIRRVYSRGEDRRRSRGRRFDD